MMPFRLDVALATPVAVGGHVALAGADVKMMAMDVTVSGDFSLGQPRPFSKLFDFCQIDRHFAVASTPSQSYRAIRVH